MALLSPGPVDMLGEGWFCIGRVQGLVDSLPRLQSVVVLFLMGQSQISLGCPPLDVVVLPWRIPLLLVDCWQGWIGALPPIDLLSPGAKPNPFVQFLM